jgi:hypothetical protein
MKKLLILVIWFPATILTLAASLLFYQYRLRFVSQNLWNTHLLQKNYHSYGFIPQVLGFSYDIRVEKIYRYLQKYRSPMTKNSQDLVSLADQYQVDPFLIVAISQCETNLGKKSPPDCFNAFGLGIYGDKKVCFDSWPQNLEAMAKTLRTKYLDYGLVAPEQIMEKYCPASIEKADGHWAKCVNKFKTEAENINL